MRTYTRSLPVVSARCALTIGHLSSIRDELSATGLSVAGRRLAMFWGETKIDDEEVGGRRRFVL